MRNYRIYTAGDADCARDLRIEADGVPQRGVRGFTLSANVNQTPTGGPAICLSVNHLALSQQPLINGPATLTIDVPVWVQFVRAYAPSPQEEYEEFYRRMESIADRNPALRELAASLAPPTAAREGQKVQAVGE